MTAQAPLRRKVRQLSFHAGLLLVILALVGLLTAASGIIPVKASSGHWPITAWFLKFSMKRSISLHTVSTSVPKLDDRSLVLKGAGHYDLGCRPCHGSPALHQPRIALAMTPHPPYLPPRIHEWDPEELFYIVKHGVKFTGMPAWPSQKRDDECWAMVAFLLQMQELDEVEYRRLVGGEAPPGENPPLQGLVQSDATPLTVSQNCARCHGAAGEGRESLGAFPKLAGQSMEYLEHALLAYADGRRHSGVMEPIAAGLGPAEARQIAAYYSRLTPATSANSKVSAERLQLGNSIAHKGIPEQKVAACVSCHGPGQEVRNPRYPFLHGQYTEYLVLQLELFKARHRGGSDHAHLMHPIADRLTAEQMLAVAAFYESQSSMSDRSGAGSGSAP